MARSFDIKPAEREKLKLSAMFMGATGSGKTAGALLTAKGIVEAMFPDLETSSSEFWSKIGVIDTEHNRAKIYADSNIGGHYIGKFLHIEFDPPYDTDSYISAINALKEAGCEVAIVDSATHAWDNTGGVLELHQNLGGQFGTWQKVNPIIKKFYQALTADTDIHIITTIRSKMKYEATTTETGKMKVSKIGLKPIMRDDFEYEVLCAIHFDEEHKTSIIKDNTHIFEPDVYLTPEYGKDLYHYLNEGVDVEAQRREKHRAKVELLENLFDNHKDNKEIVALLRMVETQASRKYGLVNWRQLPYASLENVEEKLRGLIDNV